MARRKAKKPVVIRMIKIIVTTSEGRVTSTIKAPHATEKMKKAAYRAIAVMCDEGLKAQQR